MKILVSSNCQTGGVSAALQQFIPNAELVPFYLPDSSDLDSISKLKDAVSSSDIWVSSGLYDLILNSDTELYKKTQLIKFPSIEFSAFHPDLCYAKKKSSNQVTKINNYNSAIGVWCYSQEIDSSDAMSFFNLDNYLRLGYLNQWDRSVSLLKSKFIASDFTLLEFHNFFNTVKRSGVFMYSDNHPHINVLIELSRLIAMKIGVNDKKILHRDIYVGDGLLLSTIWPVYDEVAYALAFEGNYIWQISSSKILVGIKEYLDYAYDCYQQEEITPSDIDIFYGGSNLDKLNNFLKK